MRRQYLRAAAALVVVPAAFSAATPSFVGTKTMTLKLTPGNYKAYCAPHESTMFQRFAVH